MLNGSRFGLALLVSVALAAVGWTAAAQVQTLTTPYVLSDGQADSDFGISLAGVGDLDGNGYDDVVVGNPDSLPSGSFPGFARGAVEARDGFTSELLWVAGGTTETSGLGRRVTQVDDVDGDGIGDVAARAFGLAGNTEIISILSSADGSLLTEIVLMVPLSNVVEIASVGDLTGDGIREIGAVTTRNTFQFREVLLTVGDPVTGQVLASQVLDSTALSVNLAVSIATGPDINGDGVPEIAVGDAAASGFLMQPSAGIVRVLDGATFAVLGATTGLAAGGRLGAALLWIDDLTQDGVGEILAGAPGDPFLAPADPGSLVVIDPVSGAILAQNLAPAGLSDFGSSLARGVSLLQDTVLIGCSDGLVAPGEPAVVGLEAIPRFGQLYYVSRIVRRDLPAGTTGAGGRPRPAGDVNGDGREDLAVASFAFMATPVPVAQQTDRQVLLVRRPGQAHYGSGDPTVHTLSIAVGLPTAQTPGQIQIVNPDAPAFAIVSLAPAAAPAFGGTLLVDVGDPNGFDVLGPAMDVFGLFDTIVLPPIDLTPFRGVSLFFQAVEPTAAAPQGVYFSDGLQATL